MSASATQGGHNKYENHSQYKTLIPRSSKLQPNDMINVSTTISYHILDYNTYLTS